VHSTIQQLVRVCTSQEGASDTLLDSSGNDLMWVSDSRHRNRGL